MEDSVDLDFLSDESRPMDELVRTAVGEAEDVRKSARLVLEPTKSERALLDRLMEATQYPYQKVLVFEALASFESSLGSSQLGVGAICNLEHHLQTLSSGLAEDRALLGRLQHLLTAYQRSFSAFTILHESKIEPKP